MDSKITVNKANASSASSFILFSLRRCLLLSEKIASLSDKTLSTICFSEFSDGEFQPYFSISIRGASVFLICSTLPPADNFMELLLICDSAYRALAHNISVIISYLGWSRQDKKEGLRSSIAAKLAADLLVTAKAARVIVMDLHSNQIQAFFSVPIDQTFAIKLFIEYLDLLILKLKEPKIFTIASTDLGGVKRAKSLADYLESDIIICYKERKKANSLEKMNCIGKVKNSNVIFIDDMVDTATTLVDASNCIKKKGALNIRAFITHPILSVNAITKIELSSLDELIVTDSNSFNKYLSTKIKVLSCAAILASVINLVHNNESIRID